MLRHHLGISYFCAMRVFALLFALYFTVLGSLSCAVEEVGAEHGQVTTVQPAPRQRPTPAPDWCSPLCQCHCCPGFAVPQAPAVVFNGPPSAPEAALRFRPRPAPAVLVRSLAAPWQPPQVA
jgi:hypothetical protein